LERRHEMFELFVGRDAVRRHVRESLEPKPPRPAEIERARPRRDHVRSTSAAALRSLADRLEPSRA
jgi:hypothetical protein